MRKSLQAGFLGGGGRRDETRVPYRLPAAIYIALPRQHGRSRLGRAVYRRVSTQDQTTATKSKRATSAANGPGWRGGEGLQGSGISGS